VNHPERACLASPAERGRPGCAAAELVDSRGLARFVLFVQAGELLFGVGGERRRHGAVRDAVPAGGRGGGHQVIADGLAERGAQPGGQPGTGAHAGQRLGEALAPAPAVAAGPALLPPAQ
jgi:hypothetical protein